MLNIVITAGGTSEKIDNVRTITNSSTGKLGSIIAKKFLQKDEEVNIYYICSENAIKVTDPRVKNITVKGTDSLEQKIREVLTNVEVNVFIHSMAVSDYKVDYVTTMEELMKGENGKKLTGTKISSNESNLVLVLKPTKKIISIIKEISPKTTLVGFKLLDNVSKEELIAVAKRLRDKNYCDFVVANDLSNIRLGKHIGYIIDKNDNIIVANGKEDIADKLFALI